MNKKTFNKINTVTVEGSYGLPGIKIFFPPSEPLRGQKIKAVAIDQAPFFDQYLNTCWITLVNGQGKILLDNFNALTLVNGNNSVAPGTTDRLNRITLFDLYDIDLTQSFYKFYGFILPAPTYKFYVNFYL